MRFAIHCFDLAGALPLRLAHYDAHRAYLAQPSVKLVTAGPLVADDGETMIGSLFIVEAEDRAAAEAFNRNEPFAKAGIWERVSIHGHIIRVDNRS